MIGIYNDNFIQFLKDNLGEECVKIKSNNIVCKCPFCEIDLNKNHYHLYISLEAPIWHCFHAGCPKRSGIIPDLVKKIIGKDTSDKFIDPNLLNQAKLENKKSIKLKKLIIPEIDEDKFKLKSLYVKKRLGFNVDIKSVKGMFFDINKFIDMNSYQINLDSKILKLKDFLHSNFIGFTTENDRIVIFRNIDSSSNIKHVKAKIQDSQFIDYYKLNGENFNSKHVILAEGIFDIWSEYIFDVLKLRSQIKLYASVLSSNYKSLIHSIVFNEKIYQLDISILSDRDVPIDYYKQLKYYNNHIINNLTVYYNKGGKDFNDFPLVPIKFII